MTHASMAPVDLLWTGGWDSTFQLLRLVLVHRVPVRPIYIIDARRASLAIEQRTMARIRDRIARFDAAAGMLVHPTLEVAVDSLAPDPQTLAAYESLRRDHAVGSQYEWLARFCRQHGLHEVEVGFERERYGAGGLLLDRVVEDRSAAGYPTHRLAPGERGNEVDTLFGRYSFPLFSITKQDMAREVDARGWRPLMIDTWFCHRPVRERPCARCHPCRNVMAAGFGWRIPLGRRLLGGLHRRTVGAARDLARPVVHGLRAARARRQGRA